MNKHNIKVGQMVYVEPIGNMARRGKELSTNTITKIGRKYFELDQAYKGRFYNESLFQDGKGYISNYRVWLSREEYDQHCEMISLKQKMRLFFSLYANGLDEITLDDLRKINAIITKYEEV